MISITEDFCLRKGRQKRAGDRGTRKGEGEAKRKGTQGSHISMCYLFPGSLWPANSATGDVYPVGPVCL